MIRKWTIPLGLLLLGSWCLVISACSRPADSSGTPTSTIDAREAAANAEWRRIASAKRNGAIIPAFRYDSLIKNYPGTEAAYRSVLEIASQDHRNLMGGQERVISESTTRQAAEEFVEQYAFGDHAKPESAEIAQLYETQLHPMIADAIDASQSPTLAVRYIKAYPGSRTSDAVRADLEADILGPPVSRKAISALHAYTLGFPEDARAMSVRDQFETKILSEIQRSSDPDLTTAYLEEFHDSARAGAVRQQREVMEAQRESGDSEMARFLKTGSISDFEKFLNENPNSRFGPEVELRLDQLRYEQLPAPVRAELEAFRRQIDRETTAEDRELTAIEADIRQVRIAVRNVEAEIDALDDQKETALRAAAEERDRAHYYAQLRDQLYARIDSQGNITGEIENYQRLFEFHLNESERHERDARGIEVQISEKEARIRELESERDGLERQAEYIRETKFEKTAVLRDQYQNMLKAAYAELK